MVMLTENKKLRTVKAFLTVGESHARKIYGMISYYSQFNCVFLEIMRLKFVDIAIVWDTIPGYFNLLCTCSWDNTVTLWKILDEYTTLKG